MWKQRNLGLLYVPHCAYRDNAERGYALIVVATLEVAHAIFLEASLSFLGLGVQPPTPSWGLMVSEGKGMMFFKAWVIAIQNRLVHVDVVYQLAR